FLRPYRQVRDPDGPRGPGLHRQPAPGSAVARGPAYGRAGRGHRRAARPLDHRRSRPALAVPGPDAHLPPRRRRGRNGAYARPLRTVPEVAVDASDGARTHPETP